MKLNELMCMRVDTCVSDCCGSFFAQILFLPQSTGGQLSSDSFVIGATKRSKANRAASRFIVVAAA